jgi:hypothetical protein
MPTETPEQVLEVVVEGINTGNFDTLMALYEPEAAFATQPGRLSPGLGGIRDALGGLVATNGKLDLKVSRSSRQVIWPSSSAIGLSLEPDLAVNP